MEDFSEIEDIIDLKKDKQKKKKKFGQRSEESIQVQIVRYLRNSYPDVIFRCAPDNIRMSIGAVVKAKKSGMINRSLPDIEIFEPSPHYHGLFIELKKDDFKLRKADGELYKNEHVSEQLETLLRLKNKGYAVSFGAGFDHTKKIIEDYMSGNKIEELL